MDAWRSAAKTLRRLAQTPTCLLRGTLLCVEGLPQESPEVLMRISRIILVVGERGDTRLIRLPSVLCQGHKTS